MLNFTNTKISSISIHHIGNKVNQEQLILSKDETTIEHRNQEELLFHFFLKPFTQPEFYNFTFSNGEFELNPLFIFSKKIFARKGGFHQQSTSIAQHLYELSSHPQIKSGDLFVALFTNLSVDGHVVNALGIFKSENRQSFLKVKANASNEFQLQIEEGIHLEKLDKGCLILDTDAEKGYKICILDKSNRGPEAQYWRDNFLMIRPAQDEFHHTKDFLSLTKTYVTAGLPDEFEVSRTEQIDLLNRSMEYFKTHESFNKREFEREVFQDEEVIKSFRKFDKIYREDNELEAFDNFDIDETAVKRQGRVFKSVLKLDKNFHIYIHGNRNMIEQGTEADGRKFYKIYYNSET